MNTIFLLNMGAYLAVVYVLVLSAKASSLLKQIFYDKNVLYLFVARPVYRWERIYKPNWVTKYAEFKKGEVKKVVPLFDSIRCTKVYHTPLIKSTRTIRKGFKRGDLTACLTYFDKGGEVLSEKPEYVGSPRIHYFEEIILKEPARQDFVIPIKINTWRGYNKDDLYQPLLFRRWYNKILNYKINMNTKKPQKEDARR